MEGLPQEKSRAATGDQHGDLSAIHEADLSAIHEAGDQG